jgi:hypothetical protein
MNKMENRISAVAFVFSFAFLLVTVLYIPVRAGNLPPCSVGLLRISDQDHGTSTGYPAKLMGKYANEASAGAVENGFIESLPVQYLSARPGNPMSEEAVLAKFFNCAKHAVGPLTLKKLNTLTKLVPNMEDAEEISTITKYI